MKADLVSVADVAATFCSVSQLSKNEVNVGRNTEYARYVCKCYAWDSWQLTLILMP
jgi:hypothetical protein